MEVEEKDCFLYLLSLHFMRFSCLLAQKKFESRFGKVLIFIVRVI